jgi:hypothetical protein
MAKRKKCMCLADLTTVRGHFAMIALAEIKADPSWERVVVQLAQLMIGDVVDPL